MPDAAHTPASSERTNYAHEGTVLDLLLDAENQRPWSIEEVNLEIGNAVVVADAIANLRAAGLIHKTSDHFIFASRAAVRFSQIAQ
jgi:hypothetical protein